MSKVKIQGNASGTGVLTVTAPNTSTDRTLTLPDSTGTLLTTDGDGSNLTGVSSVGGSTGVDFNDNVKARFGTGNDLEIYHSGSASFISEASGTGELYIRGTNIILKSGVDNDDYIKCHENSDVKLYYSNAEKLATTSTGATVTGALLETAPRTGQIIQRHASNPNIGHHQTNSASWTELNTSLRVTITPQYANSSIEVDLLFMFGGNNSSNITHFRIYDVTNNSVPNIDTAGSRQGVHGSARQVDTDANDVDMMFISMRTTAGNTNARTYSFQAKNEGGTTVKNYFASSSNASQLSYAKPIMRVTEVAA